jgi:hypothetical protein
MPSKGRQTPHSRHQLNIRTYPGFADLGTRPNSNVGDQEKTCDPTSRNPAQTAGEVGERTTVEIKLRQGTANEFHEGYCTSGRGSSSATWTCLDGVVSCGSAAERLTASKSVASSFPGGCCESGLRRGLFFAGHISALSFVRLVPKEISGLARKSGPVIPPTTT